MLQINIRSIKSNKHILEQYMHINNIHIAIMTETWTKPSDRIIFNNYELITMDRPDGYGGVGFLINNKLSWKKINPINTFNRLETLKINIKYKHYNLNITTFYNNSNKNSDEITLEFEKLLEESKDETTIIAGDINGHSPLWNNNQSEDILGRKIAEVITDSNLLLLNDGSPTRQNLYRHSTSAIDITLCSQNLVNKLTWIVSTDNIGSDHLPIHIKYNNKEKIEKQITNWEKIIQETSQIIPESINNIEEYIENIIKNNTSTINRKPTFTPKPWWNKDLQNLWNIKSEKQKIYNRCKTLYTAMELKKAVNIIKIEIKKAKKKSWTQFINNINPNTNIKDIWASVNKIKNKRNNQYKILEEKDNAKLFLNNNFPSSTEQMHPPYSNQNINLNAIIFNKNEIKDIINKNNKHTAPGTDKITYKLLKTITEKNENIIELITKYFNKIWLEQTYPEKWKIAKTIAIKKPGKDDRDINSYRPICLLPTFSKLFNRIILNKINIHIIKHNILNENNYGFRQNRSIMDYLTEMINFIRNEKENKRKIILISTDITKAFDNVCKIKLIEIFKKFEFPPMITNWIYQFLTNRSIIIQNNQNIVQKTNSGIPQGSCLSPTLFNIYTTEIHNHNNQNTKIFQFADDICIITTGKNTEELEKNANKTLKKIKQTLDSLKLNINPLKSHFLRLYTNKNNRSTITLKINNTPIEERQTTKILGVIFSNRLALTEHYIKTKNSIQKSINLIKIFTNSQGGAHPSTLLNIYKSIIKSKIEYAYIITDENQTIKKICQTMKNSGIRRCLGLAKTTPIPALLSEATEMPTELDNKKKNKNI